MPSLQYTQNREFFQLSATAQPDATCKHSALKPTHNALRTQAWSPSPCSHTIPRDRASEFISIHSKSLLDYCSPITPSPQYTQNRFMIVFDFNINISTLQTCICISTLLTTDSDPLHREDQDYLVIDPLRDLSHGLQVLWKLL